MSATENDVLLQKFDSAIWSATPHREDGRIANPTPLVDVTAMLLECAKADYGMGIQGDGVKVFAKLDSKIQGGSVKARPAVAIVRDAIRSGRLRRGQTVFEATSGNFGLALGSLGGLGLDVVAVVSRSLQPGVIGRLRAEGVRLIDLDVDVCPAPGLLEGADLQAARGVADSVGRQLVRLGIGRGPFDAVSEEAESLLARQDAIGLAKLLARAYGGFCTEQYDSDLNAEAHMVVTGPEIDQQLAESGGSLAGFDFVCAFGTGGTASGVGRYISANHGRRGVRVVFPLSGQDVAGIRTREKAAGLRFYEPESYLGVHEVDYGQARGVFEFFNRRGVDMGESGALAIYAVMQLLNYGAGKKFVVMVADGASKYEAAIAKKARREQVRLAEAAATMEEYGGVLWAHSAFVPRPEGIGAIASSLGCEESAVKVADTRDVQAILDGKEPSEGFERLLPKEGPVLVVCMAGNTSLMVARELGKKGVAAESLVGGITGLPASKGKPPFTLVQTAR